MNSMNNETFEAFPLEWDSNYFGVKSAKVVLKDSVSEESQNQILDFCKNYEFVTIYNLKNNKENNIWLGNKTKAFLTDINVQFIKQVKTPSVILSHFPVKVYHSYPKNDDVLRIAEESFFYSRFFNDPFLPKDKAKNVYSHWTNCAFENSEKYFVIANVNDNTLGYLLFSVNLDESTAIIELIAVDKELKGHNIGKSLISELEHFVFEKGIKTIKVGTQIDNTTAIRFYIKCGFEYVSCNSVYHYWPDR